MSKRGYYMRWLIILVLYIISFVLYQYDNGSVSKYILICSISATLYGIIYTVKNWDRLFRSKEK